MVTQFDVTKTNLSYYSVLVAFVLAFIPHAYACAAAGRNYDLAQPRRTEENLANNASIDRVLFRRIQRAKAAHENGMETIALYATAVVAGTTSDVPTRTLNLLSLGYLISRVIYNFVYIVLQENRKLAPLRSLSWGAGLGIIVTLFVLAATQSA